VPQGGIRVLAKLRPDLFVSSVYAINLDRLWAKGVRGLIVDLDNTLVPWNNDRASGELLDWIATAKARSFRLCLVSNNLRERVERFAAQLNIPSIAHAAKPRRRAFRRAMHLMGTDAANTAVIGDQLFTDVLGGNRLDLFTILVSPVAEREYWTTRLVRRVERWFLPAERSVEHPHG
jgi:HAD superfamily phosphatase (TIGR01668 family)